MKTAIQPDLLKRIRSGKPTKTNSHEFIHFMCMLEQRPEYKEINFNMKIDGQDIIISPIKTNRFLKLLTSLKGHHGPK